MQRNEGGSEMSETYYKHEGDARLSGMVMRGINFRDLGKLGHYREVKIVDRERIFLYIFCSTFLPLRDVGMNDWGVAKWQGSGLWSHDAQVRILAPQR